MKERYFSVNALSNSQVKAILYGIGTVKKLKENPLFFEDPQHFLIGDAVDIWFTEGKEKFESTYHVSECKKPSDKIVSIIQYVLQFLEDNIDLEAYSDEILKACIFHKYQTNWKEDTKIRKIIEEGGDYWDDLICAGSKKIIGVEQWNTIKTIVDSFKKEFGDILLDSKAVFQHDIYYKYSDIDCKILPDLYLRDDVAMTIEPFDIKTMAGSTKEFKNSVKRHRYDIQAAWYTLGLSIKFPFHKILPFKFIVESTTSPGICPLIYTVSPLELKVARYGGLITQGFLEGKQVVREIKGFEQAIEDYKWYEQNSYEKDRYIVEQENIIPLNLWNLE